jgi:hypothetical protein
MAAAMEAEGAEPDSQADEGVAAVLSNQPGKQRCQGAAPGSPG